MNIKHTICQQFIILVLAGIFLVFQSCNGNSIQNATNIKNITLPIVVKKGDIAAVRNLLETGADVNATGNNLYSCLHIAVSQGYMNIVKLLLEHRAQVNAKDKYDLTPLHIAVLRGYADIVKLLIVYGADVDAQTKNNKITPLHLAVDTGQEEIMSYLIEHGADVNAKISNGEKPLHVALKQDNFQIIGKLLSNGATFVS